MTTPGAPGAAAADPKAAVAKYDAITQAGADKDAALISKVEAQLANSPMGWLQGLLGEASSKGESERGAAQEKVQEMDEEVAKNKADAPPDAGAPPTKGSAAKPSVNTPSSAKGGADQGAQKKGGDAGAGKQPPKGGGQKPAAKGGGAPAGDHGGGMIAALAAGDGDIGKALDAYEPKAQGTKDTIAKIKQMGDVAKGFSGQIDTYIGSAGDGINGAIARAGNWIGEGKNIAAVWENNPYKKADGALGTIMKVLSAIKSIAGVVGSICGKIGLILTVVGLLGMIFPPIGAAVSAIARILNIVGLICDVISFALSGVLTGLNGVKLAQLVAKGATPEEKAACADLLMTEANDAAGSVISLAMQFGPKFMKGMLGKSKGILNGLMKRAKALLGNLAGKVSGNVKNFVTKIMSKLGIKGRIVGGAWQAEKGLITKAKDGVVNMAKKAGTKVSDFAKKTATKVAESGVYKKAAETGAKVWKKGVETVEKIKASPVGQKVGQAADYVKKKGGEFAEKVKSKVDAFNDGKWGKKLDEFAAKTNKFGDKIDLEMKAEKLGKKLGGVGENWNVTKKLAAGTEEIEKKTAAEAKKFAATDTQNIADGREKYLREQAAEQEKRNLEMKKQGVTNKGGRAEVKKEQRALEKEAGQVEALTKKEAAETTAAAEKKLADDTAAAEGKEAAEKAAKEARNADPAKYATEAQEKRIKRRQLEESMGGDDAERKRLLGLGENASEAEKKQLAELQTKLKPLDEARTADDLAYKTLSGGAEKPKAPEGVIETGKFAHESFKKGRDAWDTWVHPGEDGPKDRAKSWESAENFDFKNPLKWDKKGAAANAGKRDDAKAKAAGGAPALTDPTAANDKKEFHDFVVKKAQSTSIAATAKAILAKIKHKDAKADAADAKPKANAPAGPTNGPTGPSGPTNKPAGPTQTNKPAGTNQPAANQPQNAGPKPDAAHPQGNGPAQTNQPAATPQGNQPAATPQGNQPAATPQGNQPASPTPQAATPDAGGGAQPDAAPTPDAGGGAQPDAGGGGGGGGEPLPYWPHLIAPDGEFTMAMKEFTFMRKVGAEFKKGQISAKQKAVDTLAVYGKYDEYAAKRKKDAADHAKDTQQAGQVTVQNQNAAGEGEQQSGKANSEQEKGKGQAGQKAAVDLPEPESRGFWGRIIGRIKRWAKNKAAEIFGWIQEKIADVIMRGLCGVSMGDMKAYSTALKNQQARAKGVADTGVATSGQAGAKAEEVKTTAQSETAKAETDIAEADNNIAEADTFLSDINNFEQQLKSEMAQAQTFIQTITQEVTEQRNKDKEEKAKAAEKAKADAEAQKTAAQAGAAGDKPDAADPHAVDTDGDGKPDMSVDEHTSNPDAAHPDGDQPDAAQAKNPDEHEHNPVSDVKGQADDEKDTAANDAILHEAVLYVSGAGDLAVGQLEDKKSDYKNQLKGATTNRDEKQIEEIVPKADEIVTEYKSTLSEIKTHLNTIEGSTEAAVDAVISIAGDLDKAIEAAHSALDSAFTKLYDQIKGSKKKMGAQVMDGVNDKAAGVEQKAQDAIDFVEPGAEAAWSKGKDVVGAVANPIGDAATTVGAGAVNVTSRAVIGAGYVMGQGGAAEGDYGVPMMP